MLPWPVKSTRVICSHVWEILWSVVTHLGFRGRNESALMKQQLPATI
jgi:hypothetical protein